jgi:hypothetical protein
MAYYNTVIVSRKAKYIGQPMSVLIQDMDAYDAILMMMVGEMTFKAAFSNNLVMDVRLRSA